MKEIWWQQESINMSPNTPCVITYPTFEPVANQSPIQQARNADVSDLPLHHLIYTLLYEACGEAACRRLKSQETDVSLSFVITKVGSQATCDYWTKTLASRRGKTKNMMHQANLYQEVFSSDMILIQRTGKTLTVSQQVQE